MIRFNEAKLHIPFKLRKQVRQTEKEMRAAGNNELETRTNKNGDIAIMGYKTPQHDEIVVSSIIKPDGKQQLKKYKTYKSDENGGFTTKIVETWDKIKGDYIFNKRTTIQYKKSRIPEVISTMYTDMYSDDGVKIYTRYPYKEYVEKYHSQR